MTRLRYALVLVSDMERSVAFYQFGSIPLVSVMAGLACAPAPSPTAEREGTPQTQSGQAGPGSEGDG
jgi:hypothetical protein